MTSITQMVALASCRAKKGHALTPLAPAPLATVG
jgi:hypothetical protein